MNCPLGYTPDSAPAQRAAIAVRELVKRYGNVTAVDDVSFEVTTGTIFGLLGRNGPKPTTAAGDQVLPAIHSVGPSDPRLEAGFAHLLLWDSEGKGEPSIAMSGVAGNIPPPDSFLIVNLAPQHRLALEKYNAES